MISKLLTPLVIASILFIETASAQKQMLREEFTVSPNLPVRVQLEQLLESNGPAQSERLKQLDLRGTRVTDDDLSWIMDRFPLLESINLKNQTEVSPFGMNQLVRLPKLRSLDLTQTAIAQEEIEAFVSGHSQLSVIHDSRTEELLDQPDAVLREILSYQKTPYHASTHQKFFELVKSQREYSVTGQSAMRLFGGRIGPFAPIKTQLKSFLEKTDSACLDQPASYTGSKPGQLRNLSLKTLCLSSEDFIWIVTNFPYLTTLDMAYCHGRFSHSLEPIKSLSELTSLNLYTVAMTDEAMAHLAKLQKLESITLYDDPSVVSDNGMESLAKLKELRSLTLRGFAQISDRGASYLGSFPHLVSLNLSEVDLPDAWVNSLVDLKSLESLHLKGTALGGEGLAQLSKLSHLRLLEIRDLPNGLLHHLSGLNQLSSLLLDSSQLEEVDIPFLEKFPALREITFRLAPLEGRMSDRRLGRYNQIQNFLKSRSK